MSIHTEIDRLYKAGALRPVLPLMDERVVRWVYASQEVYAMLTDDFGSEVLDIRRAQARADIDWFVTGHHIDVRMKGKKVSARLALLAPPDRGTWEFRIREPKPGIRIFGAFADTDVFVALKWATKEDLLNADGSENELRYRHYIDQTLTEWMSLFAPVVPKTGGYLHDYVSRKATLLG